MIPIQRPEQKSSHKVMRSVAVQSFKGFGGCFVFQGPWTLFGLHKAIQGALGAWLPLPVRQNHAILRENTLLLSKFWAQGPTGIKTPLDPPLTNILDLHLVQLCTDPYTWLWTGLAHAHFLTCTWGSASRLHLHQRPLGRSCELCGISK